MNPVRQSRIPGQRMYQPSGIKQLLFAFTTGITVLFLADVVVVNGSRENKHEVSAASRPHKNGEKFVESRPNLMDYASFAVKLERYGRWSLYVCNIHLALDRK